MESLNLAIKKINRTTKHRFLETYELINDKFKKVFPELFQGGRAELKLTDEDNIFETGIETPPLKITFSFWYALIEMFDMFFSR